MSGRKFKQIRWGRALLATALMTLAGAGMVRAEVVNFKELMPFVDLKIEGWQMDGTPSGTTMKQGNMSVSEARATYRAGDQTLEIVVMDFLGKPMPFLAMAQQFEMETNEEKVHTVTVQDYKALETVRKQDKQVELNISVADRFWVKIDGDGIDNPEVVRKVAQQMDLKKLAGLGK
jgi:hypothetical protein